jgi:hypothetical protein
MPTRSLCRGYWDSGCSIDSLRARLAATPVRCLFSFIAENLRSLFEAKTPK